MVYTIRVILLLVHDQSSYNVAYKRKPYKECHRLQGKKGTAGDPDYKQQLGVTCGHTVSSL